MTLTRFDLLTTDSEYPKLNRGPLEDFSFGGKITPASRTFGWKTFGQKITEPIPISPKVINDVHAVEWSHDGRLVALGCIDGAFHIHAFNGYKFSSGSTTRSVSALGSQGEVRALSWRYDGSTLAVGISNPPYITFWGTTDAGGAIPIFNELSSPSILPSAPCRGIHWSPDGKYVACTSNDAPYILVYSFDGTTLVKVPDPDILPSNDGDEVMWSPDGRYLAVTQQASPYLNVYSFDAHNLVKLPDPAVLPVGWPQGLSWSPDGRVISLCGNTTPYLESYRFENGAIGAKLSTPAPFTANTGVACAWSPDGRMLVVGHVNAPYVALYYFDGIGFYNLSQPSDDLTYSPSEMVRSISWSSDGQYLILGGQGAIKTITYRPGLGVVSPGPMVYLAPMSNTP